MRNYSANIGAGFLAAFLMTYAAFAAPVIDLTAAARAVGSSAYEVNATSTNGTYAAYKAFDGDFETNAGNAWQSKKTSGLPQSITYHFTDDFESGKKIRLVSYAIFYWNHGAWAGGTHSRIPKSWTLDASNDGVSWTQIDVRNSVSYDNKVWTWFPALQSASYRYYRFNITAVNNSNADNQYVVLPEVKLMGEIVDADDDLAKTRFWKGVAGGDWNSAANWTEGPLGASVPQAGERVVIGATAANYISLYSSTAILSQLQLGGCGYTATLTATNWTTCIRADDVQILDGGSVKCAGAFETEEAASRIWISCHDLTVGAGGSIDADKGGYAAKCGPGGRDMARVGASHGGIGAKDDNATYPAPVYGSAEYPSLPGSGGWSAGITSYAIRHMHPGGGAIRIEATGCVTVDGAITANGEGAYSGRSNLDNSQRDCAGSGGSVWISCETISGTSGSIRAGGGCGDIAYFPYAFYGTTSAFVSDTRFGVPAGGGRIAIHYDTQKQTSEMFRGVTVSAAAGRWQGKDTKLTVADADRYHNNAEPGTVWFSDTKLIDATLGRTLTGCLVGFSSYELPAGFVHSAGHVRFAGEGFRLTAAGDYTITGVTSRVEIGGLYSTNRASFIEMYAGTTPVSLDVAGSLKVLSGARLDIRAAETNGNGQAGAQVIVGRDFRVGAGGSVYSWSDAFNMGSPQFSVGGSFVCESTGLVSAKWRGGTGAFAASTYGNALYGPGRTSTSGRGPGRGVNFAGGGHGGTGGKSVNGGTTQSGTAGGAYDDQYRPSLPGSGGGSGGYGDAGCGGGIIAITALGPVVVDGEINADGGSAVYLDSRSSAGSGGTIFLSGSSFSGSGVLSVKGGNGYHASSTSAAGAGGGGRIAVWTGLPWSAQIPSSRIVRTAWPLAEDPTVSFTGSCTAAGGRGVRLASNTSLTDDDLPPGTAGSDGTVWFCRVKEPGGFKVIFR